jgi:hypothetical protein
MTDPIRAALDAATRHGCGCDCERCQPGCRAQVAEEIAAFLRALPINHSRVPFYAYWHPLARAVEDAAKDRTND